jgi:hypothetical protein
MRKRRGFIEEDSDDEETFPKVEQPVEQDDAEETFATPHASVYSGSETDDDQEVVLKGCPKNNDEEPSDDDDEEVEGEEQEEEEEVDLKKRVPFYLNQIKNAFVGYFSKTPFPDICKVLEWKCAYGGHLSCIVEGGKTLGKRVHEWSAKNGTNTTQRNPWTNVIIRFSSNRWFLLNDLVPGPIRLGTCSISTFEDWVSQINTLIRLIPQEESTIVPSPPQNAQELDTFGFQAEAEQVDQAPDQEPDLPVSKPRKRRRISSASVSFAPSAGSVSVPRDVLHMLVREFLKNHKKVPSSIAVLLLD